MFYNPFIDIFISITICFNSRYYILYFKKSIFCPWNVLFCSLGSVYVFNSFKYISYYFQTALLLISYSQSSNPLFCCFCWFSILGHSNVKTQVFCSFGLWVCFWKAFPPNPHRSCGNLFMFWLWLCICFCQEPQGHHQNQEEGIRGEKALVSSKMGS